MKNFSSIVEIMIFTYFIVKDIFDVGRICEKYTMLACDKKQKKFDVLLNACRFFLNNRQ